MRQTACLDAVGDPIPWYTYPTIEYLRQLDFSQRTVFEFGCGNSTLFWGNVAQRVVSVESNPEWHAKVLGMVDGHRITLHLASEQDAYVHSLRAQGNKFDLIVVDGIHRGLCTREAVDCLRPGGMIILDNADWYPKATAFLRDAGFIQVDMSGFGPINDFTWTTSLFFHPAFDIRPRETRQPMPGVGALHQVASDDC